MNGRKLTGASIAVAAAAMFASVPASAHPGHEGGAHHDGHCMGVNACKGKSSCATKENSCAGQNACKGQGYVMMGEKACDQIGGSFEAVAMDKKHAAMPTEKADKNGCGGKNGCGAKKSDDKPVDDAAREYK